MAYLKRCGIHHVSYRGGYVATRLAKLHVARCQPSIAMSVLKYFQLSFALPKPEGPVMPSSSIAAANKEVKQVLDKTDKPKKNSKRGAYEHFIPVDVVATNDSYSGQTSGPNSYKHGYNFPVSPIK